MQLLEDKEDEAAAAGAGGAGPGVHACSFVSMNVFTSAGVADGFIFTYLTRGVLANSSSDIFSWLESGT